MLRAAETCFYEPARRSAGMRDLLLRAGKTHCRARTWAALLTGRQLLLLLGHET
jgi:hypothetical protein